MSQKPSEEELEWIQLVKDIKNLPNQSETQKEKFTRKFKENPFVPIGCAATTAALTFGLYSFKQQQYKLSQYMMRARVAAQGFTVVALVVGVAYGFTSN